MEIKESIKMILNAGLTNQKIDIGHLFEDKNFMRIMREQTFQSWLYYVCPNENFQKYYLGSAIIHNQFDKMVSKMKAKVIMGIDAHAPSDLSSYLNDEGYKLIQSLKLN